MSSILLTVVGLELISTSSDPNCGKAYDAAVDDTVGGYAAGCSQTNPSNLVSKPSSSPICS